MDNVTTDSNGKATLSCKTNGTGDYAIIAGFVGDRGYLGS